MPPATGRIFGYEIFVNMLAYSIFALVKAATGREISYPAAFDSATVE